MQKYFKFLGVMSVLLAVLLSISGCDRDIELTEADNGTEIEIDVDDTFEVTLESNPSTGFSWQNVTTGENVVQVGEAVYTQSRSCDAPGCGGEETFTFKGVSDGETIVKLAYSRPWESIPPEKTFTVNVIVGTGVSQTPVDVDEEKSDKDRDMAPDISDADLEAVVGGNTDFALSLYHRVIQNSDDNIFYSPYSISSALAMLYAGAENDTETQMAETLNFTVPQETLHSGFNYLDLELQSRGEDSSGADGGDFRLNIANAIWGDENFQFLDDYMDTLAVNYGAGLHTLDFASTPEDSRQIINQWVADQTEDKIKDLLPEGSVTDMTRMVLTNAIYFNAAWKNPFKENMTRDENFYLLNGSEKKVPMMHQTESMGYMAGDNYQAISLPYDGSELAMIIILPNSGEFSAIESALDKDLLSSINTQTRLREVMLSLPKWEGRTKFDLKSTLSAMGMPDAFDPSIADLSGITGTQDLYVMGVYHQAYVKVNEKGTEAAAATGIVVGITSVPPPPLEVNVDRPFIYLIQDMETQTILFVGRILDPTL